MSVIASAPAVDVPGLYPAGHPRTVGQIEGFALSAIAPALAVIFTNPFDTIKVRLQLQGESPSARPTAANASSAANAQPSGAKPAPKVYRNSLDAFAKILKNEGMRGLQKGLTPAILREGSKNLFRLGMYDPIMSVLHDPAEGSAPGWKRMVAGSICGAMGAVSCNPFELVKTRLQSSSAKALAVGHQHNYAGVWDALRSIMQREGFAGLYRGSMLSMVRSIVGSGTNLSAYSLMKEYLLVEQKWPDNAFLDMACGLASGIVSCIFMNPIDVTRTRFYNQPYVNGKGVLYSSGVDAVRKIATNEGPAAFYKGFITHFLRIGPHFCLTFVFLGVLRRSLAGLYADMDAREAFQSLDRDGDGVLDEHEVELAVQRIIPNDDEKATAYYAQRIIEKADHDHDHLISFSEFRDMESEVKAIVKERKRQ
ncbi:hypothetical protein HK105_205489 [Polyrhizophydium stewartii]|uniref:EF-hand domain-containing protein n=1 Tax=Polyrhizophydium stewartii TaxID=2732419 RepID=A0ABR4N5Y9_9FUNG